MHKKNIRIAKSYLTEPKIKELNRIVTLWLDFAEDQAEHRQQIFLQDGQTKLDQFLQFNECEVLTDSDYTGLK